MLKLNFLTDCGEKISSILKQKNGPSLRMTTTNVLSACTFWIPFTRYVIIFNLIRF